MKIEDAYKLLDVEFPATRDEVKKAFHRLAHIHHPDKGGDVEMFKRINTAHQFLMQSGYWDVLASSMRSNEARTTSTEGQKSRTFTEEIFMDQEFMYDEDTHTYCVVDKYGEVLRSWMAENVRPIDATSWQDLDYSVEFKDYNGHLTDGHKRIQ